MINYIFNQNILFKIIFDFPRGCLTVKNYGGVNYCRTPSELNLTRNISGHVPPQVV